LTPSATEIVSALGAQDQLVAVTSECDEPASARTDHRVVVRGVDTSAMPSREIDDLARSAAATGDTLSVLDADALVELAPDLVLTQDLCRVCALPSGHVEEALERIGGTAEVLTLDPHTLDDVLASIVAVGRAIGRQDRASALVAELRSRLAEVRARVAGRARPRVVVLEWVDPPYSAGHWVPDLVTAAGGTPVLLPAGRRSEPVTWPAIYAAEPDVAVVAPCGFRLGRAVPEAATVLPLLPGVGVWAMDADGLVVRPGPRLVTGVEALSRALHPVAWPDEPDPAAIVRVTRG
jgi:iron complex transport system substrate-binding protein